MGNFNNSYNSLLLIEGGYVNDPDDKGGETYKGVARNYHPDWKGWERIDKRRKQADFPKCLDDDFELQNEIKAFYKKKFWDIFNCDNLPDDIAEELFEQSVNIGVKRTVEGLQESLNALNMDGDDLEEDGIFGVITLARLVEASTKDPIEIYNLLNITQANHYKMLAKNNRKMRKFLRGWLKRIVIKKRLDKW